jgi:mycothiol synthase
MNAEAVGTPTPQVIVSGELAAAEVREVEALLREATDADGVQPLSEHVWLHLRHGGEGPDLNLRLTVDGTLVGYAHLDPTDPVAGPSAEVVVHPAHRGRGYGRLLVQAALDAAPGHQLRLWSHGDHPAARALARSMGFTEVRRLEQWRRSLRVPLPEAPLPPGVRLRTFRPGQDDTDWLALNAAAFASHPEQGAWTEADLRSRMAEAWFDPAGFLLAEEDSSDPRGSRAGFGGSTGGGAPRVIGFHWTKVHGGDRLPDHQVHGAGDGPDQAELSGTSPGTPPTGGTKPPSGVSGGGVSGGSPGAKPPVGGGTRGAQPPVRLGHGHEVIGEVYVVGVHPDEQGRGLGRALTVAGLRHLRDLGLGEAMLYVESDNEPAKAVYRRLGFTWWDSDVMFLRTPSTRPGGSREMADARP